MSSIDSKVLSCEVQDRYERRDKQNMIDGLSYPERFTMTYDRQSDFDQIFMDLEQGFSKYKSRYDGKIKISDYWRNTEDNEGYCATCQTIKGESKGQAAIVIRYISEMYDISFLYGIQRNGQKVKVKLLSSWLPEKREFKGGKEGYSSYVTSYKSIALESLNDGTLKTKFKCKEGDWSGESSKQYSLDTK